MKVKVSEATGPVLDLLVSRASNPDGRDGWGWFERDTEGFLFDPLNECRYSPSTDWAQGGPIIERLMNESHMFFLENDKGHGHHCALSITPHDNYHGCGPTPMIAAMRCYATSKLGKEAEVPDSLV